uniref:5'-(N(7)-methylguanosine 5'-triphospho)-[mRNA] hydrolase n=1 Tax=Amphiprion percula TaxID=161767 RepID=A0A3P8T0T9_AMPPE
MEPANAGHLMSLAALQRQDPYITRLLDVTGQVALYNFNSKANEWEKTEIEGTLFVYARSASPRHGFTIMNRLSTENLVEPINKDLEFQLQDPFLLYRNGNLGIYSIWFYDKRDCQRIAQLMVKIVKQEADHAQRTSPERVEPGRTNGMAGPQPIDILELLSKAKEEYQRTNDTKQNKKRDIKLDKKSSHMMVKQITVEELFGSSLPKDPSLPSLPPQNASSSHEPSTAYIQKPPYPPPAHQSSLLPPQLAAQDPGSNQRHQGPGLLPAPYTLHPEHRPAPPGPSAPPPAPPATVPSVNSDIHKPILAPNFLPSTLVPPYSFQEPMGKPLLQHGKDMDVFSQPPNLIKPIPGLAVPGSEISVLLSPSAFQQAINTTTGAVSVVPPAPSEASSACGGAAEPPAASCSKTQLQETLIHLIKHDADFLSAIHEAYLQTLSKDFSNMKL